MLLNPYIAGNPISDEVGFFGRDHVFREVMRVLRHSKSNAIVLYGQRRIGKTSVLLQLQRQLTKTGEFTPVYFDLQDKASKPLSDVLYELAQQIASVVGQSLPQRTLFDAQGYYFRESFLPDVTTAAAEGGLVLLFDEFDVLDSPQRRQAAGDTFFPYLRSWMNNIEGVQFVFVIGRRPEDLSTDTISTFKRIRAKPVSLLKQKVAADIVRQAERQGTLLWPDEAVNRVWKWAQGHPYLTQLLCNVVWENAYEDEEEGETPRISADQVDAAVEKALEQGANAFHWIWDGLPPAERVVIAAMADANEPVITHDKLVEALNRSGMRLIVRQLELAPETLVKWDLLQPIDGGHRFTVPLWRQWVRKNKPLRRVKEELDHIEPAAERLFESGQYYYRSRELNDAEDQLQRALKINPNHLKAKLLLGKIFLESDRVAESLNVLEEAYQYDAGAARADLIRALLARADGQNEEEQLVTYDRILKIDANQPVARTRQKAIWRKQGEAALPRGHFDVAIEAFERAGYTTGVESVRKLQMQSQAHSDTSQSEPFDRTLGAMINPFDTAVFVGYDSQLNGLRSAIQHRSPRIIVGMPQMGKTTIMKKIIAEFELMAYTCIYMAIEEKELKQKDFWEELGQRIRMDQKKYLQFKSQRVDEVRQSVIKEVLALAAKKRVVIAIDRFDLLILRDKFAIRFFNGLQNMMSTDRVSFVFSSYYTIEEIQKHLADQISKKRGVSTMEQQVQQEWLMETAARALESVGEEVYLSSLEKHYIEEMIQDSLNNSSIKFDKDEIEFVFEQSGGIPSLAKWLSEKLYEEKEELSFNIVNRATEQVPTDRVNLRQFGQQLASQSSWFSGFWTNMPEALKIGFLLTAIAHYLRDQGSRFSLGIYHEIINGELNKFLSPLTNYGAIQEENGKYQIKSPLLSDWISREITSQEAQKLLTLACNQLADPQKKGEFVDYVRWVGSDVLVDTDIEQNQGNKIQRLVGWAIILFAFVLLLRVLGII